MNELPAPENAWVAFERVRCPCALHGASMTSGSRTADRNAAVGGAPKSRHLISLGGLAWDLVPDDATPAKMIALAADAKMLGFWTLVEVDHVHIDARDTSETR